MSYSEARQQAMCTPLHSDRDLVAADIAMGHCRARERADIYMITSGLSEEDIALLGYSRFENLQKALDAAFRKIPGGTIGLLPRGGDCFPFVTGADR